MPTIFPMHIELSTFLKAIGPTASLIFAAWIFLSFLQTRYSSAYELYRALCAEYRQNRSEDKRKASLRQQILEYKRRCEQMRRATQLGVLAAIALISAIILGGVQTLADVEVVAILCVVFAIGGLLTVIAAAAIVLHENARLQVIIDSDISDIEESLH